MVRSDIPAPLLEALLELRPQLEALASADLPDAWLGAGAIRNRVWNRVLGDGGPPDRDWDVAFAGDVDPGAAEERLAHHLRGPWEATDQRRFGHRSAADGIASWPETATAVAARLAGGRLEIVAPFGVEDLVSGVLRRSPGFTDEAAFHERRASKRWRLRWPSLTEAAWAAGVPDLTPRTVEFTSRPDRVLPADAQPLRPSHARATGEPLGDVVQLSELTGMQHLRVHRERLAPGRRSSRAHHHTTREEAVYVLRGDVVLVSGQTEIPLGPGDFAALSPGPPMHVVRNDGQATAEMIVMSAAPSADEVVYGP